MIDDRTPKQWDFHTRYPPENPGTSKLPLKMDGWKPLSFWADDCNYTTWMSFNFCNSNTHEHRRVLFRALNMNRPDLLVQRISSQSDMRHVAPWMQFKFNLCIHGIGASILMHEFKSGMAQGRFHNDQRKTQAEDSSSAGNDAQVIEMFHVQTFWCDPKCSSTLVLTTFSLWLK